MHAHPGPDEIVSTYWREGRLLGMDGRWLGCELAVTFPIRPIFESFWIESSAAPIARGLLGSPITTTEGVALGVFCSADGPNPILVDNLPSWARSAE